MSIKRSIGLVVIAVLLASSMSGGFAAPAGQVGAAAIHSPQASGGNQVVSSAGYYQPAAYPLVSPSPTPACGPAWNIISTTNVLTLTNQFFGISAADAN